MATNKERGSVWDVQQVANSNQKVYSATNVYYLTMINDTAFSIDVRDTRFGTITIPAGKQRTLPAHPMFAVELVTLSIEFNSAAPDTDFLTIIATKQYGSYYEEC